jgi:hypothetical protein
MTLAPSTPNSQFPTPKTSIFEQSALGIARRRVAMSAATLWRGRAEGRMIHGAKAEELGVGS